MRKLTPFLVLLSLIGVTLVVSSLGTTQSVFKNDVGLQATTPGTSQSGHLNISGTARAGTLFGTNLTVTGGAASGSVLKSDASGNATWQTDSLTIPASFIGSIGPYQALIAARNESGQPGVNALFGQIASGDPDASAVMGLAGGSARGIFGVGGTGVWGHTSEPAGVGVRGVNVNGGVAGRFEGKLQVTGQTSIGTTLTNGRLNVSSTDSTAIWVASGGANPATALAVYSGGVGIYSENSTPGNQPAGYFKATGTGGIALLGQSSSGSGIVGSAGSANGIGVRGENLFGGLAGSFNGKLEVTGATSIGTSNTFGQLTLQGNQAEVLHVTNAGTGRGMYILSPSDTGIWTNTTTGLAGIDARGARADGYGVVGTNNGATAWAVFGFGRSGATGVKSFRIDHPLDPENKFLLHYSAEGPEPMNVYSGNVTTDAKGEAWVQLPDYFGDINRDLRYTLTVVEDDDSDDFVMAKVARKVQGNRFKIRTSAPNVEVSWRVEGVRNDRWVQRYGAPSEMQKSDAQRGRYQHPELYDLPQNYSMLPAPVEAKSKK